MERYVTEIHAREVLMLGGKRKDETGSPRDGEQFRDDEPDDIPF